MRRSWLLAGAISLLFTLPAISKALAGESRDSPTVVILVEPPTANHPPNGLGFSVVLGEARYETAATVIEGLQGTGERRLAILVDRRVPIGSVSAVASIASKAVRYSQVKVFVFDDSRTEMLKIPEFKWVEFSADPAVVGDL